MRKVIFNTLIILITLGSIFSGGIDSVAATSEQILKMNGKSFLNVPEKNWNSFDQVTEKESQLSLSSLEIDGNTINIDGTISYNDTSETLNFKPVLKRSRSIDGDYVFSSNKEQEIQLVHGAVRFETPQKKTRINKGLKGKTVLNLYFFDNKSRDLIMFEQPLPGYLKKQLDKTDYSKLEKASTDTWAHKIVDPTVVETYNTSALEEDTDKAEETIKYPTAWGDTIHYAEVKAHAYTSTNIDSQGKINSSLTLKQYIIPGGETEKEWGSSNIWIGRDDKVTNKWTLYDGQTGNKDMISRMEYTGEWASGFLSSVSVGVGYGLISSGFSFKDYVEIPKTNFHNVYKVEGEKKPYYTEIEFTGTHLHDSNDFYDSNIDIITLGAEGEKSAQSAWSIEFYDSYNSEPISSDFLSAWVYYNSTE